MSLEVVPQEVRAARSFLYQQTSSFTKTIPPRKFASVAKELGISFSQLLKLIGQVLDRQAGGESQDRRIRQRMLDSEDLKQVQGA